MTLTEQQRQEIDKKAEYAAQKEKLLTKRKALLHALEYADNDVEEGLIKEEREQLATQIKALAQKLRQIEAWEAEANI